MSQSPDPMSDVLLYFLAIFVPPVSVLLKRGFKADFWINVLLCILAWLPGVIHAWYVIAKYTTPASVTAAPPPVHHNQYRDTVPAMHPTSGAATAPGPLPPVKHEYPSQQQHYQDQPAVPQAYRDNADGNHKPQTQGFI